MRTAVILAAILFSSTSACAAETLDPAIADAVTEIYAPYKVTLQDGSFPPISWERPIYTKEVTALISRWESVMPEDEVDDLNGSDWLCLCQDWDSRAFKTTIVSSEMKGTDAAHVVVDVAVFGTEARRAAFDFKREAGVWKIDELTAEGMETGLKQALRDTIAKDEAL